MRIGLIVDEFPGASDRFVYEQAARDEALEFHVFARRSAPPQLCTPCFPATLLLPEARTPRLRRRRWARATQRVLADPAAALAMRRRLPDRRALDYLPLLQHRVSAFHIESPQLAHRYGSLDAVGRPWTVEFSIPDLVRIRGLAADERALALAALRVPDRVVIRSATARAALAREFGIESADPTALAARSAEHVSNGQQLFVDGPLDYRLGLEYTLLALSQLRDPDLRVVVAGHGPLQRYLRYTAGVLGLDRNIRWLGVCEFATYCAEVARSTAVIGSSLTDEPTVASTLAIPHRIPTLMGSPLHRDPAVLADSIRRLVAEGGRA